MESESSAVEEAVASNNDALSLPHGHAASSGSAISPRAQSMKRESKAVENAVSSNNDALSPSHGPAASASSRHRRLGLRAACCRFHLPACWPRFDSLHASNIPSSSLKLLSPAAGCGTKAAAGCTQSKGFAASSEPRLSVAAGIRPRHRSGAPRFQLSLDSPSSTLNSCPPPHRSNHQPLPPP